MYSAALEIDDVWIPGDEFAYGVDGMRSSQNCFSTCRCLGAGRIAGPQEYWAIAAAVSAAAHVRINVIVNGGIVIGIATP
jgi:hypothetical protein